MMAGVGKPFPKGIIRRDLRFFGRLLNPAVLKEPDYQNA